MTARKKIITPQVTPFVIGLDIGYGNVKAVLEDQRIVFPSVAAHSHTLKFQEDAISAKHPGEWITDGNESWFIGSLAIRQAVLSEQIQLQGRDNNAESNMRFRLRMMYAALAKLMPYGNGEIIQVIISTGLPVDHMADAESMKKAFIGRHRIDANNAGYWIDVIDCHIMPQPYGTIYAQMITDQGVMDETHAVSRVAVTDAGRFTVDCALDDDGDFIDAQSGSVEAGVHTAQERIAAAYEAKYGAKPSHTQVEDILRNGQVLIGDEPVSFVAEVEEALRPMRAATLSLMGRKWGKALDIQRIYVTGGGARFVFASIKEVYKQAILVENPQMSNAIGYRNYALFTLSDS